MNLERRSINTLRAGMRRFRRWYGISYRRQKRELLKQRRELKRRRALEAEAFA